MKCDDCSDAILDLIEGELSEREAKAVREHLHHCSACQQTYDELAATWNKLGELPKPSPDLAQRFAQKLEDYATTEHHETTARPREIAWFPSFARTALAYVASIALAFLAGSYLSRTSSNERLASIETELSRLKEVTALSLLAQSSPAERMRGAELLGQIGSESPKSLETLYHKVSYDPSINVRYAALETLDDYAIRPDVREKLIQLLSQSDSPLIRAELIKLLVKHNERASLPMLKRISEDEEENETVRKLAKWSVEKLETQANEAI